jgi:hypothetical protein
MEDILGLFDLIDSKNLLNSATFAAINLDRVPRYGPEEINICAVVDRQLRTDIRMDQLTQQLEEIRAQSGVVNAVDISASVKITDELNAKLLTLKNNIEIQLHRLDQHRPGAASSAPLTSSGDHELASRTDSTMNLVVTGIAEDKNFRQWHSKLINVLQTVAGRDVSIIDAFRLGRFKPDRTRPILVK